MAVHLTFDLLMSLLCGGAEARGTRVLLAVMGNLRYQHDCWWLPWRT